MVVFVDPKQSYIEIVQNIGRICRKNDRLATVLIPAYVDVEKYKDCNKDQEKIDEVIRKEMSKTGDFNGILNVLFNFYIKFNIKIEKYIIYKNLE